MSRCKLILVVPLVLFAAEFMSYGPAVAGVVSLAVNNYSFESPILANNASTNGQTSDTNFYTVTQWHVSASNINANVISNYSSDLFNGAYDGANDGTPTGADGFNVLNCYLGASGRYAYVYQDLGFTLSAGTYSLAAAIGERLGSTNAGSFTVGLATSDATLGTYLTSVSGSASDMTAGSFVDKSLSLTVSAGDANIGKTVRVVLYTAYATGGSSKQDTNFDNIRLTFSNPTLYFSGGNSQTWDTSSTTWGTVSGTYNTSTWADGADAIFEGTGAAVTVGTVSASSLAFNVGGYTLNDGQITLSGSSVTTSAGNTTIASAIAGTAGLTKLGDGTLSLTGNNTYTGATAINAGTLQIGDGATTGSLTSSAITNNASLVFNNPNSLIYSGVIGGAGSFTKSGEGMLTLSGSNTYTGTTTINAGTLSLNRSHGTIAPSSHIYVNDGATLGFNTASTLGYFLESGTGGTGAIPAITVNAGGTICNQITGSAAFTQLQSLDLEGGTVAAVGAGDSGYGNYFLWGDVFVGTATAGTSTISATNVHLGKTGGVTFTVGAGSTLNVTGTFSGTATNVAIWADTGLIKAGDGMMLLAGSNTYIGDTVVNGGTLSLSSGDAISDSGAVLLANAAGATLELAASETIGALSGGGETGGNVNLNANTLTVGGSADATFAGVVSGTGKLVSNNTAKFYLTGENTFSGGVTINSGNLVLSQLSDTGASNIGNSGDIAIIQGTLEYTGSTKGETARNVTFGVSDSWASEGDVEVADGCTLQFGGLMQSAHSSYNKFGKYGGGTFIIGGLDTNANSGVYLVANAGTVQLNKASSESVHAVYGIYAIESGATVQLTGSGSYQIDSAGAVTLNGGVFDLNGQSQTGTTLSLAANSTLANTGSAASVYSATSTALGSYTLTVAATGDIQLDNAISGSGGITKTGSAKLILSGANTYEGETAVGAGSLVINGSLASDVTIASAATLGGNGSLSGAVVSAGTLAPGESVGKLTLAGGLTATAGTYAWELGSLVDNDSGAAGTNWDAIDLAGSALNASNVTFSLAGLAPTSAETFWSSNHAWTVFENASLASSVSGITISGYDTSLGTFSATTALSGTTADVVLTWAAVPEPGSIAMLFAGMLGLIAYAWRRRK